MQDAISQKLVEVVSAIQYDGSDAFAGVYDYDRGDGKYDQWPVAIILPEDTPSDLATNTEVHRRSSFYVYITLPLGDVGENRQQVYQNMRILCDLVCNTIDDTIDLNGLRANNMHDRVLGVVPATAGLQHVDTPAGLAIMQSINVIVRYDHFTGN